MGNHTCHKNPKCICPLTMHTSRANCPIHAGESWPPRCVICNEPIKLRITKNCNNCKYLIYCAPTWNGYICDKRIYRCESLKNKHLDQLQSNDYRRVQKICYVLEGGKDDG